MASKDTSICGGGKSTEEQPNKTDVTEPSATHSERVPEAGTEAESESPMSGFLIDEFAYWLGLDMGISTVGPGSPSEIFLQNMNSSLPCSSRMKNDVTKCSASHSEIVREAGKEAQSEFSIDVSKLDAGILTTGLSTLSDNQLQIARPPALSRKSYSPLFVSQQDQNLIGYESTSKRWDALPAMSYIPQVPGFEWCLRAADGSLFCWTTVNSLEPRGLDRVLVTNPLTKSWKILPDRPRAEQPMELVSVVMQGTTSYKVLLGSLCTDRGWPFICIQIFDSTDGSWTMKTCFAPAPTLAFLGGGAIVNGVLHILVRVRVFGMEIPASRHGYSIVSLDLKDAVWKQTRHLYQAFDDVLKPVTRLTLRLVKLFQSSELLVCEKNLMLVALHKEVENSVLLTLSIFRLDVESGRAVEVSRAPQEMISLDFESAACVGDCIYIGNRFPSCLSILYNVRTQQWDRFNSIPDILRPVIADRPGVDVIRQWQWMTPIAYQPGGDLSKV